MNSDRQTGTVESDLYLNRLDRLAASSNLSRRQLLVWISQLLNPDVPLFNMIVSFRIEGPVDRDRFERAFRALVGATDSLRTVIEEQDGFPRQRVVSLEDDGLEYVDLSDESDPAAAYSEWVGSREKRLDRSRRLFDSALARISGHRHHWYLNLDHLITDAWSFSLIFERMEQFYRSAGQGLPESSGIPTGISLIEHCRRERDLLDSRLYGRARTYWNGKLEQTAPELALYGRRPSAEIGPAVRVELRLDDHRSRALRDLGRTETLKFVNPGMTRLCMFSALFAAYLHRVGGENHLSFGIPLHNRRTDEAEQVVGPLMEICPLMFRIEGGESYLDLFHAARAEVLGALKYSQFSLANPAHRRIFNVTLNYFPASFSTFDGCDTRGSWISSGYLEEGILLNLQVEDHGDSGEFVLWFDFNAALFSETARARATGHFLALLDGFLANPEQGVQHVDLLSDAEKASLRGWCYGADDGASGAGTVVRQFEARVREQPDAAALERRGETLTCSELNRQANRLAHRLRRLGVEREDLVGLIGERSVVSMVGLLGILKAGGVYFPLPPEFPDHRLRSMARDAGLRFLIGGEADRPGLRQQVGRVLTAGGDLAGLDAESDENPAHPPQPGDAAYLLYTSGTTGTPNGFLVEHRSWENFVLDGVVRLGVSRESRILQYASLGFDLSLAEVGLALGSGGVLVMEAADELYPGPELIGLLRRLAITHLVTTPPALSGLSRTGLPDLQVVMVAGDKCTADTARRWAGEGKLFNSYGPAETTIVMTCHQCGGESGHPPLGRPITNTFMELLDERGEPVPQGVAGELCIGGICLAREYLGNPGLTAERFIPDNRSGRPGSRLYRSGDMARFDEEGNLEFIGRRDRQAKVRGYRTELEEIERTCSEIHGVGECAVRVEEQSPAGEKIIAAYVTAGATLSTLSLRRELREKLPGFMIPSKIIQLDHLPRTGNLKIDYEALGGSMERIPADGQQEEPTGEVEKTLAVLWAEMLGLDRVGRHDRYFDLGGDSLSAMQIIARARTHGISFSIKDLFRHQTIAMLAGSVSLSGAGPQKTGPVAGAVPLTPIQQLFFRLCPEAPENSLMAMTIELAPGVTAEQLEQALCFAVDHHDALRSIFQCQGERWVQEIKPPGCRPLFQILEKQQYGGKAEDCLQPFDLSRCPLLQVLYLDAGAGSSDQAMIFFHHLVMDAYSMRILLDDLEMIIGQLQAGQQMELAPKGSWYKEWSERLATHAQSEDLRREAKFWAPLAEQAGASADEPAVQPAGEEEPLSSHLDKAFTANLLSATDPEKGVTVQSLLLCALWEAWSRVTGREMLYVALEDHGRETPLADLDILGTIGWFTAVYPLRLKLAAADTRDRLREMVETLGAVPGRGSGFGMLRYLTALPEIREMMKAVPEPGIAFNFLGHLREQAAGGKWVKIVGDPLEPLVPAQARRFWPLQIVALVADGRLRVNWNGLRDMLGSDRAEQLVQSFEEKLYEFLRTIPGSNSRKT